MLPLQRNRSVQHRAQTFAGGSHGVGGASRFTASSCVASGAADRARRRGFTATRSTAPRIAEKKHSCIFSMSADRADGTDGPRGNDEPKPPGEGGVDTPPKVKRGKCARGTALDVEIAKLKSDREQARKERMQLQKSLKNATKRRSRLLKRASALSNNDLFDIMQMRSFSTSSGSNDIPPAPDAAQAQAAGTAAHAAAADPEQLTEDEGLHLPPYADTHIPSSFFVQ